MHSADNRKITGSSPVICTINRVVAQMVERVVWDHEAASSRLAYPTKPLGRTEVFLLEQKQNQENINK